FRVEQYVSAQCHSPHSWLPPRGDDSKRLLDFRNAVGLLDYRRDEVGTSHIHQSRVHRIRVQVIVADVLTLSIVDSPDRQDVTIRHHACHKVQVGPYLSFIAFLASNGCQEALYVFRIVDELYALGGQKL